MHKFTHPSLLSIPVFLPQLLQSRFFLLLQIREFLNLGLVQTIDNWILPFFDMYALDLKTS